MSLATNLEGRLRNTPLPEKHALLPLFEAIVNSIQAIEDKFLDPSAGQINVKVVRSQPEEQLIENTKLAPIEAFSVRDNGIGFTNTNLKSFETLDSNHKIGKGGKGIGRLLWLKAFESVTIHSHFENEEAKLEKRTITFNSISGIQIKQGIATEKESGTVVHLHEFKNKYERAARKKPESIIREIIEHCFWYFIRDKGIPSIIVEDGEDEYSLDDIFAKDFNEDIKRQEAMIADQNFEITHVKIRNSSQKQNSLIYCADSRQVKNLSLKNRIPYMQTKLKDEKGTFTYFGYVIADYLNDKVRAERFDLDIPETTDSEDLLAGDELSFDEINTELFKLVKQYLNDDLKQHKDNSKKIVDEYIDNKAPKYKLLWKYIDSSDFDITNKDSEHHLELRLHEEWSKIERKILETGQSLLRENSILNDDDYNNKLTEYIQEVSDLNKSDLASYICQRRIIIDLLEKEISQQHDAKYAHEKQVHRILMPLGVDSSKITSDEHNLWLVDERLAFHHYISSNELFSSMPITETDSTKRPDILGLNIYDNPVLVSEAKQLPLASINVIELKRPMAGGFNNTSEDRDPIAQAINYVLDIRNGNAKTKDGRPIPSNKEIPAFCYIIADLTPSLKRICQNPHDLKETADKMGYFGYKTNAACYVEVMSFDRLAKSARERNNTFFTKLGIPN